ncbi:RNA polymerase sigma factor [Glycomyces algeriensis]|uniref:RNA polymerase subunit sigma-24 n=1 Tax=Glycomyces algeriensis TaxID=256037 RepID=A0A9W6GA55_9ACTN|nr:sigma-70 family RNA polymerase sigma factor [Glycomyces algeriensis]MDA1364261.1 sigma-70 family RNA polymerase sigma factor [Glycomyces algeriensis]MDR7350289.1 RNA polymerase sigma factor (sigma-70 family) [Glycomyces algeriensis]GLI42998.1 RNA polymerase subunit sigma-24 [Glycomyces algeriensis]
MDLQESVEALWRIEAPQLIATLARRIGDLDVAEDLTAEAFAAAIEQWSVDGIPPRPGAWLMSTARHKAIDRARREETARTKAPLLAAGRPEELPDIADQALNPIPDDLLTMLFTTCHPMLSPDARVALTLRLFGGLTTDAIARAYLVPSPIIGQRITRAKRTLAKARVPIERPSAEDLPHRFETVLEVLYAIFNEGYSASSGDRLVRTDLAIEAMRMGRILAGLVPTEPEVLGLVALMELQASRFRTRTDSQGLPVQLQDQDRRRWDRTLIDHALRMLDRALELSRPLGPYAIQAAIAACHARAATFADTDWATILALYDALLQITGSPVVELNRAVAVLYLDGPQAALDAVEPLRGDPRLARYHLLGAVRGDLLVRLDRHIEAAAELEHAAALAPTRQERQLLLTRMAACLDETASETNT